MAENLTLRPPTRFDREDKARWKRACSAREQAGIPVKPGEIDTLADWVDARARIDDLNVMLDGEYGKGGLAHVPTVLRLHSLIASATRAARQLAMDLRLSE